MPYLNNDLVHMFYWHVLAYVYGSQLTFDAYCIDAQTDYQNRGGPTGRPFQKGGSDGEVATGAPNILEGSPGPPIYGKGFPGPPGFPDSRGTYQNITSNRTVPSALGGAHVAYPRGQARTKIADW